MHLLLQSFENEASFSSEIKFTTDTTMKISISEQLPTQQVCWYSFRQTRTIQKSQQFSTSSICSTPTSRWCDGWGQKITTSTKTMRFLQSSDGVGNKSYRTNCCQNDAQRRDSAAKTAARNNYSINKKRYSWQLLDDKWKRSWKWKHYR